MKQHSHETTPSATAMVKVPVCGEEIDAARIGDTIWISVRRVCDVLGVASNKQIERLRRKPWASGTVMVSVAEDGKAREIFCIPHRAFPMWLATIDTSRSTAPGLPAALERFQREAADVLHRHFFGAPAIAPQGITAEQLATALAPFATAFEALAKTVAAMNDRVAALEERARDGRIGREQVNAIKARASSCAKSLGACGVEKTRAASLRIHKRLKMRVGWYGDFCRLDNLPARHEAEVIRELEIIEHETRGKVDAARQLKFPTLSLVANANSAKRTA